MLRVHARKVGDIAVLCLRGGIVVDETTPLRNKVQSLSGVTVIVLDLKHVTRVDAGGLGVLLKLRGEAQAKGVEFRLMNVTRLVQQVLEITRLNSVFEMWSATEISAAQTRSDAGVKFVPGSQQGEHESGSYRGDD